MRIVSFDTSTSVVHLALLQDGSCIDERLVDSAVADRKEIGCVLMPEIDGAVKRAGWSKADIDMLVVGTGPGSFTGIRVAVITARTLAQALHLPLVGISLLETFYYASRIHGSAAVTLATTSNQFFYGIFGVPGSLPVNGCALPAAMHGSGCGPAAAVAESLESVPVWLADEKFLLQCSGERAQPLPEIKNIAKVQAQLAVDRLSLSSSSLSGDIRRDRGTLAETFPWAQVLPLYLRSPSVTVTKTNAT